MYYIIRDPADCHDAPWDNGYQETQWAPILPTKVLAPPAPERQMEKATESMSPKEPQPLREERQDHKKVEAASLCPSDARLELKDHSWDYHGDVCRKASGAFVCPRCCRPANPAGPPYCTAANNRTAACIAVKPETCNASSWEDGHVHDTWASPPLPPDLEHARWDKNKDGGVIVPYFPRIAFFCRTYHGDMDWLPFMLDSVKR